MHATSLLLLRFLQTTSGLDRATSTVCVWPMNLIIWHYVGQVWRSVHSQIKA